MGRDRFDYQLELLEEFNREWLTIPEYSQSTGIHDRTLRQLICRGKMPFARRMKGRLEQWIIPRGAPEVRDMRYVAGPRDGRRTCNRKGRCGDECV